MAVSQAVKGSIRRWCEITEIPWSEQKIIERVRAFRADARDRADEGIADPEALAELLCGSFSTLLLTKYAETIMEALVAGLFDCALTTAAKQKLTGDAEINWEAVATAIQENEELEGSGGAGGFSPAEADIILAALQSGALFSAGSRLPLLSVDAATQELVVTTPQPPPELRDEEMRVAYLTQARSRVAKCLSAD